jgi:phospholipid N-methyltransferase
MKRNKNFYENYHVKKYFLDIANNPNRNFINHLNDLEMSLFKEEFEKEIKKVLVIGMGYGREIDWLKKIFFDVEIDVIDFSKNFIDFGQKTYRNVNFLNIDLNYLDEYFDVSKYNIILSFNTIDYLEPEKGVKLIKQICSNLSKNSLFIFRLQNKSSFMAPIRQFIINKRDDKLPVTFHYDCHKLKLEISKIKSEIDIIKSPILLEGLDFLYQKFWNLFSYFEFILRLLMPKRYCNALYFKFRKKS